MPTEGDAPLRLAPGPPVGRTAAVLCRLPMVRAGLTRIPRESILLGSSQSGLSEDGRREVERLTHHWEWAEAVVSSPVRRAWETAQLLAGKRTAALDPDLRPRDLGPWEGRSPEALRAMRPDLPERWVRGDAGFDLPGCESPYRFRSRVAAALDALLASPYHSTLLVSHLCVIRAIAALLVGPLPPGRPWPAEMVMITRRDGSWGFGRCTSDPEPLRSPFERSGLSGRPLERAPERHVARLTIRADLAVRRSR